ncbi:MAG: Ig-like domain-containing protein [Fibrobacterales bacterium]
MENTQSTFSVMSAWGNALSILRYRIQTTFIVIVICGICMQMPLFAVEVGRSIPTVDPILPQSLHFMDYDFPRANDAVPCSGITNSQASMGRITLTQTQVMDVDWPFFFLTNGRPALMQVMVSGQGAAPQVKVQGFVDGSSIGELCLKPPVELPAQPVDIPSFTEWYTVTLPKEWIRGGLSLNVTMGGIDTTVTAADLAIEQEPIPYDMVIFEYDMLDYWEGKPDPETPEWFHGEFAGAFPATTIRLAKLPIRLKFPQIAFYQDGEVKVITTKDDTKGYDAYGFGGFAMNMSVLYKKMVSGWWYNSFNYLGDPWTGIAGGNNFSISDYKWGFLHEFAHSVGHPHWWPTVVDSSRQIHPYYNHDHGMSAFVGEKYSFYQNLQEFITPVPHGATSGLRLSATTEGTMEVRKDGTGKGPWTGFGDYTSYRNYRYLYGFDTAEEGTVPFLGETRKYRYPNHPTQIVLVDNAGTPEMRRQSQLPKNLWPKVETRSYTFPQQWNVPTYLIYGSYHPTAPHAHFIYDPLQYTSDIPRLIDPTNPIDFEYMKGEELRPDMKDGLDHIIKITYVDGSVKHVLNYHLKRNAIEKLAQDNGWPLYYMLNVPGDTEIHKVEHFERPLIRIASGEPQYNDPSNILNPYNHITAANVMDEAVLITSTVMSPLAVSIASPVAGFVEQGAVTILADAVNIGGVVSRVDFYIDGIQVGTDYTSPFEASWSANPGNAELTAVAFDQSGNSVTSAVVLVTIVENRPPDVMVTAPIAGATYREGAISIEAHASDPGGTVTRVEFYSVGSLLGTDDSEPYSFDWTPGPGDYTLTAKAVDNEGAETTSDPIAVSIVENQAPNIAITYPEARGYHSQTFVITTEVSDVDGPVAQVDFYIDGSLVSTDYSAPYEARWIAGTGYYTITAVATDDLGAYTTSDPRVIAILEDNVIFQDDWTLHYVDSEAIVYGNNPATNAFDGNLSTHWHTPFYPTSTPYPHEIQIQLGAEYTITGLIYVPRQDDYMNGTIKDYEIYFSTDGINWGSPQATGVWANNQDTKTVSFAPATGRYLRLRALSEVNNSAWASAAEIYLTGSIAGSENSAPQVAITAPIEGSYPEEQLTLAADASDSDGSIIKVDFYANGTVIGSDTSAPYTFDWLPGHGAYTLTVVAEDNEGATSTSVPVSITVMHNQPPVVTIVSPTPGGYDSGVYAITAQVEDKSGIVDRVEFWSNEELLGNDHSEPYEWNWNASPGLYSLVAVAVTDNSVPTVTSDPVEIEILEPPQGVSLPGRLEVEDYNEGGSLVSYDDKTPGNSGGKYREDDVDIEETSDDGGGYNVGWIDAGEWLKYTVVVEQGGLYTLTMRMASAHYGSKSARLSIDGVEAATFTLSDNRGWQKWNNVVASGVALTEGVHTVAIYMLTGSFNINYIDFEPEVVQNKQPLVTLTNPQSGTYTPGVITLTVDASDEDGEVTQVEFFADNILLGSAEQPPFEIAWVPVEGFYTLSATAYDDNNAFTISEPVAVTIAEPIRGIEIPGRIEAEDYDSGGEGIAYHDQTQGNSGGKYRSGSVDIESSADVGGGYNVGWIDAGEWLFYTVYVQQAGVYDMTMRMASGVSGNKTASVSLDGQTVGTFTLTETKGWQEWQDVKFAHVFLSEGTHTVRIEAVSSLFNINYLDIYPAGGEPIATPPPIAHYCSEQHDKSCTVFGDIAHEGHDSIADETHDTIIGGVHDTITASLNNANQRVEIRLKAHILTGKTAVMDFAQSGAFNILFYSVTGKKLGSFYYMAINAGTTTITVPSSLLIKALNTAIIMKAEKL